MGEVEACDSKVGLLRNMAFNSTFDRKDRTQRVKVEKAVTHLSPAGAGKAGVASSGKAKWAIQGAPDNGRRASLRVTLGQSHPEEVVRE